MYMAMPSGNVVIPEKMHGGGAAGAEIMAHYQRQWVPDERDGFISWIRSEFAAANAIIDSMCNHLKAIGEPGEYDGVIGSLQQRRVNWYPVLHMQQYFSVSEVVHSLQQATWRRQQHYQNHSHHRRSFDQAKGPGKRFGVGGGYRQGFQRGAEFSIQEANESQTKGEKVSEKGDEGNLGAVIKKSDVKDLTTQSQVENVSQSSGDLQAKPSGEGEGLNNGFATDTKGSCEVKLEEGFSASQDSRGRKDISINAKTFVGTEIVDGKSVNAVDGMKLYEGLLDSSEVANLVSLANDLRTAGRKGHFEGPTFIASNRPSRGHGRDMIQLGVPIVDPPLEDGTAGATYKDRRIEPIPSSMQDVIERIIALQAITVEPDCCIIDFYNEGDHSLPYMWPHRYGRPVCVLFLTECDMTFGKAIAADRPGDYKGSFKLSLTPGSMLVMQGRSTDFARHALPALQKQRILITLTKSQPKRSSGHYSSATGGTQNQWVPPHSRSSNHIYNTLSPKRHTSVSTTGVLPAPPICMPLPPSNGVQPLFMPTAVAPVLPFPAPVALPPTSAGWTVAGPRHPPPRLPVPGTGVFLPPGSGNLSNQTSANESLSTQAEQDNNTAKLDGNNSGATDVDKKSEIMAGEDCNGNADGTNGELPGGEEQQQQQQVVVKVTNEPAETVL